MSIATAHVLLHRFYCRESLADFEPRLASLTALWLATKLEEAQTATKNILRVYDRVTRMQDGGTPASAPALDTTSARYAQMHADMIAAERTVLAALGYTCRVEHPHKLIINITSVVLNGDKELCQLAWTLCNDSFDSTLCVRFRNEVIACGCIYLAARRLGRGASRRPAAARAAPSRGMLRGSDGRARTRRDAQRCRRIRRGGICST